MTRRVQQVRPLLSFAAFVLVLGAAYSLYKMFGQAIEDAQTNWWAIGSVLPATDDLTLPPLGDIVGAFFATPRAADRVFLWFLFDETMFTLRSALVGFMIGVVLGFAIAVLLARSKPLERSLLPYVLASQTIPLVAIAPIIVIWGRKNLTLGFWDWTDWMSVSIIATYLAFFPVAVNGLRGLQSPKPGDLELMESLAATRRQRLWKLQLPASVPYLFASLKIAATASVVGAIVGEISAGVDGGLGRRILLEAQRYTTGPERLYAGVIAAALLGIAVYVAVRGLEWAVLRRQGREVIT